LNGIDTSGPLRRPFRLVPTVRHAPEFVRDRRGVRLRARRLPRTDAFPRVRTIEPEDESDIGLRDFLDLKVFADALSWLR